MLELSPALVQAGLREQSMEAHQGTSGALSDTAMFIVFSVTTDTSLFILVRRSVMFRTQRMAMNIVLKIAADENEMSQSTEVQVEIGDRLAIVGEVVTYDNLVSGSDRAVGVDRDGISVHALRHRRVNLQLDWRWGGPLDANRRACNLWTGACRRKVVKKNIRAGPWEGGC